MGRNQALPTNVKKKATTKPPKPPAQPKAKKKAAKPKPAATPKTAPKAAAPKKSAPLKVAAPTPPTAAPATPVPKHKKPPPGLSEDQVRIEAFYVYEERSAAGRPGDPQSDWDEALRRLKAAHKS